MFQNLIKYIRAKMNVIELQEFKFINYDVADKLISQYC